MPRVQNRIDFDGAIVTIRIELGVVDEASFRASGRTVPPSLATTALIDPGASITAIHPFILDYLGAIQSGERWSSVPGHPETRLASYDVRLTMEIDHPAFEVRVVGIIPATHTVAVLIGRDILKKGTLLFDGENERFSFWF
jgi:hypothetical protein